MSGASVAANTPGAGAGGAGAGAGAGASLGIGRAMLPLDEALARLVAGSVPYALVETEAVSAFDALGRVLAQEVRSTLDVPPADNTSMDGYALRAADVPAAGTVLPVSQRIPAGVVGQPLLAGTAARIFTGAQVPAGADAVVMQEQCEAIAPAVAASAGAAPAAVQSAGAAANAAAGLGISFGLSFGYVRVLAVPSAGQWVRRRGEDVREGATVLTRGTRLTPQALGLAASVGAGTLTVLRRPRVAIFSTGDELVMPGEPLKPGAIYNSNRFTLRGLLQAAGCEVTDFGIVPDRLDATRDALRRAALHHDLIVTSGGVSVGEEDHLRPAVLAEGRLEHWQIAIKPGKPLAFGAIRRGGLIGASAQAAQAAQAANGPRGVGAAGAGGTERAVGQATTSSEALFVGLPGNPVSSFVTHLLCVNTVLRALQGLPTALPAALPLRAAFDWPRPDKRREFLRVRLNAAGQLELFDNQSSGVLTSAVWADGLVDNPPGQAIARGDTVRYLPLAALVAH